MCDYGEGGGSSEEDGDEEERTAERKVARACRLVVIVVEALVVGRVGLPRRRLHTARRHDGGERRGRHEEMRSTNGILQSMVSPRFDCATLPVKLWNDVSKTEPRMRMRSLEWLLIGPLYHISVAYSLAHSLSRRSHPTTQ